jgi:ribose/xylose/arabinose/galactoside ABC-type transport system permease subunit
VGDEALVTDHEVERVEAPSATTADERISHRGPMQRWLISPEIGALIGAVLVWAFFWGVGRTFGEADTTLNWLDVAAPAGIMATAVALLMIGGEVDLSAGVITGATAIHIGLFSQYFMGEGVSIGWGILGCFLAAGVVGWFNGFMVNKTGLPSFIITLASFFVLRGVILVMAKRLGDKVQVNGITDEPGAPTYRDWIAHEWNSFTDFDGRDQIFLGLVIIGALLFTYGLLEQSFIRRAGLNNTGIVVFTAGALAAAFGFRGLHTTDGISNNVVFTALCALGTVVAVGGLALARWQTRDRAPVAKIPREVATRFTGGLLGVGAACLVGVAFDRKERLPILTWLPTGARPIVAVAAALTGIGLAVRVSLPALRSGASLPVIVKTVFFSLYSGLVALVVAVSVLQLSTVQALRATAMAGCAVGGVAMIALARGQAAKVNRTMALAFGLVGAAALVVLALRVRADSGAVRFRTGLLGALIIGAVIFAANTVVEYLMKKRTYGDAPADNLGRRLQIAGGIAAFTGLAVRLVWSNYTPEQAAALKAAGEGVSVSVLRQTVLWWLLVAAIGAFVLTKTRWGNWIFAVGGNRDAARAVGVPADQVKIWLFVGVSLCGALSGTLIALRYGSVQANVGTGEEFEYIIAAVVGGCLMTGGYGSVIGACFGAALLAMSTVGMQTVIEWDSNGRFAFLGGVLLAAVLVNNYTRKKAQEAR